ncbi:MAG: hypothetical protein KF727_03860 [Microbacteriaceae bacterium]|nr:hypothetical protein [Microbacteriaceae bacterium]
MPSRWFRIAYAENALRRFAAERGADLHALRTPDAVSLALDFYRDRRGQHARVDDEGDGMLWQWGPDADAARFTIALTRQLIREDAEPITQLTLCLAFRWTPVRRALGRGHAWCWSTDAVGAFEKDIRSGAAYRAVAAAVPAEIILRTDTI